MNNTVYKNSDPLSDIISFHIYTKNNFIKYVGTFNKKDKVFRKDINESHKFHKADSFGIDAGIIDHLDKLDCIKIILKNTTNGDYYSIPYERFLTKGWVYPRTINTKVQGEFQPSFIASRKWWRIRNRIGDIIQEPLEEGEQDEQ